VRDASRIRIVINGVDTEQYRPRAESGALRCELGLAANVPIIGSIGRLERIKGYDVMIEALARLRGEWPDAPAPVLVLGGEGSERARLEALARARGVAEAVHFLGWRDDIHELHAAFTLFTMSSRSEGTSVSLLEAMSSGLCPVVTRVGGNAAVLGEPLAHRLVAPADPPALASAWRDALTNPDNRACDAGRARQRVLDDYSLDAMVRAYESLYDAAVE